MDPVSWLWLPSGRGAIRFVRGLRRLAAPPTAPSIDRLPCSFPFVPHSPLEAAKLLLSGSFPKETDELSA